jgi:hypothetical protein
MSKIVFAAKTQPPESTAEPPTHVIRSGYAGEEVRIVLMLGQGCAAVHAVPDPIAETNPKLSAYDGAIAGNTVTADATTASLAVARIIEIMWKLLR